MFIICLDKVLYRSIDLNKENVFILKKTPKVDTIEQKI